MNVGVAIGALPGVEVLAELGRGAETVVYRIRTRGGDYALKVLTSAETDTDQALAAVRREAALLACVDHPLLPRIYEVGRSDAGPYLILELIEGASLSQELRAGRFDEPRALSLAIDVAGPLAAAHRAGLVHRDVKPDNVMISPTGTARLIDFGLASRGDAQGGGVAGTLAYSAPEQSGMLKRPVDGRSDLYALGVMLYECLTGEPPFRSDDAGELIRLHATAPVPDIRAACPGLSPTFAAIVSKLLAKDPDDRYPSGESLLADLERLRTEPGTEFPLATSGGGSPTGRQDRLVGRANELSMLTTRWRKARARRGGIVLVQGQPGGGKSRLVRELTSSVRAGGHLVLHGKSVPDDPVPLAPLRAAVEQHIRTIDQLPPADRDAALARLREVVGSGGALLRALSPMLAALVSAPELADDDRHEQFMNAAAAFLVDLAEAAGGAVIHLDDVQWLDGATRRLLQQLAPKLSDVPLLVVATARDDADSQRAVESFRDEIGDPLDTCLSLNALDDHTVAELVTAHLGTMRVSQDVTDQLVARVGGNPFAVVEYVRAVIDAGLMTPSWDDWQLDVAGLDRLELSSDAIDLVLRRIDGLGDESRRLLAAGAAVGIRFRADLVARVCDVDLGRGLDMVAEADSRRLLTATDGGYVFLHDRIREALLAELDPGDRRRVHQRIAEALDAEGVDDPEHVYATARHYALGECDRTPERVYATGVAAGRLALVDQAPAEALEFLQTAAHAAEAAGIPPDVEFHRVLGVGCSRTGRFAEAIEHLDRALRAEPDPLRRADIYLQMARVHISAWDPELSWDVVCQGMAELDRPIPRNGYAMAVTTLVSFLIGLVIGFTKIGFGTAAGERRERYRLQAELYDIGAYASSLAMRVRRRVLVSLRALYVVNRLGRGVEYTRHLAGLGLVADVAGRHGLARRIYARAQAGAAEIGDPALIAYVEWKRGVAGVLGGVDNGEIWQQALAEHERWFELGDYLTGVSSVCLRLTVAGRIWEAQRWHERGAVRLASGAKAEGAAFGTTAAVVPAQLGRRDEAAAALARLRDFVTANPYSLSQRINLVAAETFVAVEQDEFDASFETVVQGFAKLGLKPRGLLAEQRIIYACVATARLAQARRAASADLGEQARRLAAAEQAVKELAHAADKRVLPGYVHVARADLAVLQGRPEQALDALSRAERRNALLDAPMIDYETARVRARAYRLLDAPGPAERQARYALTIANQQQWRNRARWVRVEFGIADESTMTSAAATMTSGGSGGALNKRRLAALQQVSLAAATVLEPRELARVALDETVQILGAERAYLFLLDAEHDRLVAHLGRDGDGNDIDELTGYSSTLVERVRDTREALVVTGSEEGVALGSRSALVHGLRSIMIAPLQFDGRLLGVVYLDSRVAKGIFTAEDVDILTAITHHVAVSLETARAAQLEVVAQTARRQRDVAETLRATMAELSATLDPDEVMRRLLEAVTRLLPGDTAALLGRDGDRLIVSASFGSEHLAAAVGQALDSHQEGVAALGQLTGPHAETSRTGLTGPLGRLIGAPRSWVAIPVAERGQSSGVILVGSDNDEAPPEAQVQVVAALVEQGMIAYENARLFSQVRHLATVDGLTGLNNRNHFFTEARQLLETSQRHGQQATVMMLDIDHFKRINDTYGHPVGDEVIRTVATRLRESTRSTDVIGRYGGEEFALVSTETGMGAASLAERLRTAICSHPVETEAEALAVTISVGMAYVDAGNSDLSHLLARADGALYAAKQNGRNRVEVSGPPEPE